MFKIFTFTIFSILLCIIGYFLSQNVNFKIPKNSIYLIILIGFIIRIVIAYNTPGFLYDINTYGAWAQRVYQLGFSNFYSTEVLTDYPPLYIYVLYLIGFISSKFNLQWQSNLYVLLLKLPAILGDIAICHLIYKYTKNKHKASIFALIFLFLPVVIINSASWGQIDSLFTLLIILMCVSIKENKMYLSYLFYGIGILLKPQTLIFTPILMVGIIDNVLINFNKNTFLKNLLTGLSTILLMMIICLPFGLDKVLTQYIMTLKLYGYASVNAYNFWAMLGMNWANQSTKVLFLSANTWGSIAIVLIVIFTFILSKKYDKKPNKYFILSAYIIFTMFMFSVRMHERYIYPFFALVIFALIEKPSKLLWFIFIGVSALNYLNTAHILYFYEPQTFNLKSPIIYLKSTLMLLFYLIFIYGIFNEETDIELFKPLKPISSKRKVNITRIDFIIILAITLFYSLFALYDLGDNKGPESVYNIKQNESIILEFKESPDTMSYYIAPSHNRNFSLETSDNSQDITLKNVFTWQDVNLENCDNKIKLTLLSDKASIIELSFKKGDKTIKPINYEEYKELFDESNLVPERYSFRNSMYFDEIYHARTAYEFINKLHTYEYTHPPLGKIFISLGISAFGMNPFGYRIIGTLFGILMLPFIYIFSKKMFNNTLLSSVSTFIFAFDFMHFVQTRIATIDVYVTFFIILMFYFMYEYCTKSFYDTKLKDLFIPLGLSGISMGLAIASKWTGVYAGIGIAIVFFMNLIRRYREYLYAKNSPYGISSNISHKYIIDNFKSKTIKLIIFCIVFFIIIPIIIYTFSYIPFIDSKNTNLIKKMVDNQINIFNYHSKLEATHYFGSPWYQWPIMVKPVWYYSGRVSETLREGITSFGNPLVWWIGIPAFLYQIYILLSKKFNKNDKYNALFILIAYLSGLLPWVFVTRITFIYHYFPCVLFVVLMIVNSLKQIKKHCSNRIFHTILITYSLGVFLLFILFYPILSGRTVELSYVENYLRWFSEWFFVSN